MEQPSSRKRSTVEKVTNGVGLFRPIQEICTADSYTLAHSLQSKRKRHIKWSDGLFYGNVFPRRWPSPQKCILLHNRYKGATSTNSYRNRWSQMKQIPLSVPIHLGKQSVKENDMLLNALPKEGWPSLQSSRTTLKYGPQLNFFLCIWLLIHCIGKYIHDRQVSPSPVNNGTIKPGKTGLVTRNFCSFTQHLLAEGLKVLFQRR